MTGGASGIGRATAFELCRLGARVVVADSNDEGSREVTAALRTEGHEARHVRTDVTSPEQVDALVRYVVDTCGRLDVMFNNAGIGSGGRMLDWTAEQFTRVVQVNQNGVFYCMQSAARAMRDAGRGGVIINTGSVFGDLASLHCIGYQATKAAVEVMTKVAAHELAPHGIRVVNVAPGVVDTPIIAPYRSAGVVDKLAQKHMRGKLVQPEAVARVVAFLATDAASAVNGTTVYADDGYSAFK